MNCNKVGTTESENRSTPNASIWIRHTSMKHFNSRNELPKGIEIANRYWTLNNNGVLPAIPFQRALAFADPCKQRKSNRLKNLEYTQKIIPASNADQRKLQ